MKTHYQLVFSRKKEFLLFFSEFFLFIFELITILPSVIIFKYYLKGVFKNNLTLFVLGNGPSLVKDLKKIKKKSKIFAVNTFLSQKYFKHYKPDFLCFIDSMFSEQQNRLSSDIKVSIVKTFEELNRADWPLTLFVPKNTKKIFEMKIKNKNINIIPIPSIRYDFESSVLIKLLSKFKLPPPRINVVITSIYIGILLNFREINILGVDMDRIHSFKVNQVTNKSFLEYVHFSKSKKNIIKFKNKFKDRKETSMYVKLVREATAFKWYAYIAMVCKETNVILKNKSSTSLIDSIER